MKKRILSSVLAILLLFTLCGCDFLDLPYGDSGTATEAQNANTDLPQNSSFAVHFIDVGQADAALVICENKTMLIDGGNAEDSNLIYSYLEKHQITHLDYVVCTHAHEDHVGGLSGALTFATVGTVFAPVTTFSTKAFQNFVKKVADRGASITVPTAGQTFQLGSAAVTVLGPLKDYEDTNDTSIVLRIVYGELSFLFTGDMESLAETDLVASGAILKSTVLKVGHHGSSSSTSYHFLREVDPTYAVISVGTDNSYGHPTETVLSRLRDADVQLYRTDLQGDIVCTSNDGKTLTFTTAKNSGVQTNPTENEKSTSDTTAVTEYAYIGNLNSKKYHRTDCYALPSEENRIYFTTKEEAQTAGYEACGICNP
ncbi:MAG: MBL fold metallo-hydrolase [Clostridia bacterium]|nr:MBL fold metallo-hydrolase [Clostridia bacterium]